MEAPVIIDDAHRLDGLVEAVAKVAVKAPPQADGGGPAFILMGSQAFASAVEMPRFTLFPLTQAERRARRGCIIDDLFDGTLCPNFLSRCTRSDLRTMRRGRRRWPRQQRQREAWPAQPAARASVAGDRGRRPRPTRRP